MPPAILDKVEDPDLKANYLAYFKIIQSVLGKRPGTPEQKKQIYHKLQKHLVENVTSVDALIDEIPRMAGALGIPAQTLSGFVAQNFLKALEMARKELEATSVAQDSGAPAAADPDRDHDILGEILESIGPVVQAPNKFVPSDMGTMKLVTPSGEQLPVSLTGEPTTEESEEQTPAPSSASTGSDAPDPRAVPAGAESATGQATTVTGKKSSPFTEKEVPIIQEILNRFGNHLDVHEKLEPAVFPKNFQKQSEDSASEQSAVPTAPAGEAAPAPASGSGGVKTNSVPKPASPVIEWPDENVGLIDEILQEFGNVLSVHEKLEPSDGLSGGGAAIAGSSSSAGHPSHSMAPSGSSARTAPSHSDSAASSPDELEHAEPKALVSFARYTEIRSRLAGFQKAGDQQGYREFLQGLSQEEKLIVPIRNLENKLHKNPDLRAGDEIYNLSVQLGISPMKLASFRQAMLRFDRIQLLLNDFVQRVKKGPAPLMKAVQQIWSQVRLLLNEVDHLDSMKSQLRIILLGIQDHELKKRTQEILESMLNRANNIFTGD